MDPALDVFVFRDTHYAPDGDTVVCIAEERLMRAYLTKRELAHAFSGCAIYWRRNPGNSWFLRWRHRTYIGVWGKKNAARFRRFLRERGAKVEIHRERPPETSLAYFRTEEERRRVRVLPPR